VPGQGVRLDQRDPRGDGQGGALGQGNRLFEQDGSGMGGAAMDGVLPGPQVVAGREVTTAGLARQVSGDLEHRVGRLPVHGGQCGQQRSGEIGPLRRDKHRVHGLPDQGVPELDRIRFRTGPDQAAQRWCRHPASLVPPRGQGPSRSTVHAAVRHRPTLAV